jgi:hypothetical protein
MHDQFLTTTVEPEVAQIVNGSNASGIIGEQCSASKLALIAGFNELILPKLDNSQLAEAAAWS